MRINRVGLVRKLIRRGFAVSAIQSTNQWQPWGHYLDAANLDAAEDFLAAEAGGFAKGLPTVGVCVSRGCSFLHWLSKGTARDMRANYYSIPWGIDALALQTGLDALPPTLAAVGEQDRVPFSNTAVELTRFAQRMNALGKLSLVRVNREAPADECFHNLCLMPGVDAGAVQALVRELRATGVLDAEGRVAVALPTMQGRENPFESLIMDAFISVESLGAWPLVSLTGPHLDWIYQELSELQAGHRHTSDFDAEVLDYFLAAVNGRPGRVEKFERDEPAAPPAAAAEPGPAADAPTALDAVLSWGALILR